MLHTVLAPTYFYPPPIAEHLQTLTTYSKTD